MIGILVDHQEEATIGLDNKMKMNKKSHDFPLTRVAGVLNGKTFVKTISWHVSHFRPSVLQNPNEMPFCNQSSNRNNL